MTLLILLLFTAAVLFLAVGIRLLRGDTNLIHAHTQERIPTERRKPYIRAVGKSILLFALTFTASGSAGILYSQMPAVSLWILTAGMAVSVCTLLYVQRKYRK